jgi:hypothetical protein
MNSFFSTFNEIHIQNLEIQKIHPIPELVPWYYLL